MSTDTRLARLADLREASREVYEGYEAIVKEQEDEIVRLTGALDECRQLLAQAFGRPAVEKPKRPLWRTPRKCDTCPTVEPMSQKQRFCHVCGPIERERLTKAARTAQVQRAFVEAGVVPSEADDALEQVS